MNNENQLGESEQIFSLQSFLDVKKPFLWIMISILSPLITFGAMILGIRLIDAVVDIKPEIDWYWLIVPGAIILIFLPGTSITKRILLTIAYLAIAAPLVGFGGFALACSLGHCWPTP